MLNEHELDSFALDDEMGMLDDIELSDPREQALMDSVLLGSPQKPTGRKKRASNPRARASAASKPAAARRNSQVKRRNSKSNKAKPAVPSFTNQRTPVVSNKKPAAVSLVSASESSHSSNSTNGMSATSRHMGMDLSSILDPTPIASTGITVVKSLPLNQINLFEAAAPSRPVQNSLPKAGNGGSQVQDPMLALLDPTPIADKGIRVVEQINASDLGMAVNADDLRFLLQPQQKGVSLQNMNGFQQKQRGLAGTSMFNMASF